MNFAHFSNTPEIKTSTAAEKPSKVIWDLDWNEITAKDAATLDEKITVRVCDYDFIKNFLSSNTKKLFTADSMSSQTHFLSLENSEAKERFYNNYCDIFAIYLARTNTVVGIFIAHPSDWSTYYIRYTNFLPEYRNQGFSKLCFNWFYETTKNYKGIDRIEMEVSPANQVQNYNTIRLGYILTGNILSDRWGSLSRYTKYINKDREQAFTHGFCANTHSKLSTRDQ